jgi:hypothetical protein
MRTILVILGTLLILSNCDSQKNKTIEVKTKDQRCFFPSDTVTTSHCSGCGGGFVFKNIGERKYLVVSIDEDKVQFSTTCSAYDLSRQDSSIYVWVDIFKGDSAYATNYCTDLIIVNMAKPTTYTAIHGRVIYSKDTLLNVKVEDLILVNASKTDTIMIKSETFYRVDVSNYPG